MAYKPTEWINTIYDADGKELQKGTPYTAENMNKIESELEDVSSKKHVHLNKDVLDKLTNPVLEDSHTHDNKAVLDSILADNVHVHLNKEVVDQLAQSHIDASHTHANKELLDEINPANVHSHTNKAALDNVTQNVIDSAHTHANKAVLDKVKQSDLDSIKAHGVTLTDHEQQLVNIVETITSLKIKAVQTIAERDALTVKENVIVHVVDASTDSTVTSGWAQYLFQSGGWVKIAENESIDVVLAWADIVGKPASFPPSTHTHTKEQVGLGNVDNVKQATKAEFDAHANDDEHHITPAEREGWNAKAGGAHTHTWNEVTGKPGTFAPSAHTHTESDIIGLDKYTKAEVNAKLGEKAAVSHTHLIAQIAGLQSELDGKETPTGSQTKATTAENNAKTHADNLTGNRIVDNRSVSPLPLDYERGRTAQEFKLATSVSLGGIASPSYVHVFTERAWGDDSGGYIRQLAYDGKSTRMFARYGIASNNTWSAWDELETTSGAQSKVNTHANDTVKHVTPAERSSWNGLIATVQSHATKLSEMATHTHSYNDLTNKPTIPSKTSQLTNDSQYVKSNAGRIHVSYSDSDIPPLQPNDIVLKVI